MARQLKFITVFTDKDTIMYIVLRISGHNVTKPRGKDGPIFIR